MAVAHHDQAQGRFVLAEVHQEVHLQVEGQAPVADPALVEVINSVG